MQRPRLHIDARGTLAGQDAVEAEQKAEELSGAEREADRQRHEQYPTRDPELGPAAALGHLTCAKPVAREAVRLQTVDAEGRAVLRTFRLRGDNRVRIGETSLGDMPPVAEIITEWSGSPKPLARSALFIGTGHRDDEPGQAEGYRVELELPGSGRCLAYTYGVRRL